MIDPILVSNNWRSVLKLSQSTLPFFICPTWGNQITSYQIEYVYSNSSHLCMAVNRCMVYLINLCSSMPSTFNYVPGVWMIKNHHIFWIERNHVVISRIWSHMSKMNSFPTEEILHFAIEMKCAPTWAICISPISSFRLQPFIDSAVCLASTCHSSKDYYFNCSYIVMLFHGVKNSQARIKHSIMLTAELERKNETTIEACTLFYANVSS